MLVSRGAQPRRDVLLNQGRGKPGCGSERPEAAAGHPPVCGFKILPHGICGALRAADRQHDRRPVFFQRQARAVSDKNAVREAMRAKRRAIPGDLRQRAPALVRDAALALPEIAEARIVALYCAIGSELDLAPLAVALEARGITIVWPTVAGEELRFAAARLADLVPGSPAPVPPPQSDAIAIARIDVVMLPALAFDRQGGRLGQGFGFYDRTLAHRPRPFLCGAGFAAQILDDLPLAPHDVSLDALVTETITWRFSA